MNLPPLFFLNIENIHASKIRPSGGYDPAHLAAGKCNHTYHKMGDEITYPFPNFNGYTIEFGEWMSFHPALYWTCEY